LIPIVINQQFWPYSQNKRNSPVIGTQIELAIPLN